ncbi:Ubiquitin carboxyl-terminal hydrolase 8 [Gurleya vavrai]
MHTIEYIDKKDRKIIDDNNYNERNFNERIIDDRYDEEIKTKNKEKFYFYKKETIKQSEIENYRFYQNDNTNKKSEIYDFNKNGKSKFDDQINNKNEINLNNNKSNKDDKSKFNDSMNSKNEINSNNRNQSFNKDGKSKFNDLMNSINKNNSNNNKFNKDDKSKINDLINSKNENNSNKDKFNNQKNEFFSNEENNFIKSYNSINKNEKYNLNTPYKSMVVEAKRKALVPKKVINRRNNCFCIAALQVLLSVDDFVEYFLYKKINEEIAKAINSLLLKYEKKETVDPDEFIRKVSAVVPIMDGNEQDAHEFLIFFLQALYCELGGTQKALNNEEELEIVKKSNFIAKTFFGMQKNTTCCKSCGKKNHKYEEFMIQSFPLKENIMASYEEYTKCESSIKFQCEECKKERICTKTMKICIYPPVLIIHLRRFLNNKQKDSRKINVERILNFEDCQYKLSGLIKHHGNLHGGHYVSDAERDETWWHFDDTNVYKLDVLELCQSDAYILFYSKL